MCKERNVPRERNKNHIMHAPYLVPGFAPAQVCTTGELNPHLGFSDKQETMACGRVTTVCVPTRRKEGRAGRVGTQGL